MRDIVMIVPMTGIMSFPEEFHTDAEVDGESQESQELSVGKAMIAAVVKARTHPNYDKLPNVFYSVMFATITGTDG